MFLSFFLFSINSVNSDPDGADKDKEEDEDDSYNREDEIDNGKSIGSFVSDGPKNNQVVPHLHVVMNHNPQEESMTIIFTGLSSHLAFFMTLPGVLSVSSFI